MAGRSARFPSSALAWVGAFIAGTPLRGPAETDRQVGNAVSHRRSLEDRIRDDDDRVVHRSVLLHLVPQLLLLLLRACAAQQLLTPPRTETHTASHARQGVCFAGLTPLPWYLNTCAEGSQFPTSRFQLSVPGPQNRSDLSQSAAAGAGPTACVQAAESGDEAQRTGGQMLSRRFVRGRTEDAGRCDHHVRAVVHVTVHPGEQRDGLDRLA